MKSPIRRREVSRLEALSDTIFGFSATLLVVSLEVPSTFPELVGNLSGFIGFALSFGALVAIWTVHNAFFRRYGLTDGWTVFWNSCLLFVVLFYVYPLKFVTTGMAYFFFGIEGAAGRHLVSSLGELATLFVIYGIAFIGVFVCFAALYRHAYRIAPKLELSAEETEEAAFLSRHYAILAGAGLLSIAVAVSRVGIQFGLPGWVYALLGPACHLHYAVSEKRSARRRVA